MGVLAHVESIKAVAKSLHRFRERDTNYLLVKSGSAKDMA
jgi:hypothetical protein